MAPPRRAPTLRTFVTARRAAPRARGPSRAGAPRRTRPRAFECPPEAVDVPVLLVRGEDEERQRARRVLDGEVAVRDLAPPHRVAVGLVHGRVDDLAPLEAVLVERGPRRDEDRKRSRGANESQRAPPQVALPRPAPPPVRHARAARASRTRRTGRTTGCRVRPVRQDELEAEQQHAGERRKLERRLVPRQEREDERADDEQPLEETLQQVQVGNPFRRGTGASPRSRTASRARAASGSGDPQNSLIACQRLGSRSRIENAAAVAHRNPKTASPSSRRVNRYVSHIGATMRAANFVHPQARRTHRAPRAR